MDDHIKDCIMRADTRWQRECTDFLRPEEAGEVVQRLKEIDLPYMLWGGYPFAERVRILMDRAQDITEGDVPIVVVRYQGNAKYLKGNHRDWLGALMSLGFKREKVGDILVRDDGADVLLAEEMLPYLAQSSLRIRGVPVTFSTIDQKKWQAPEPKIEQSYISVDTPRLDAVLARALHLDRKTATRLIQDGMVQVNHVPTIKPSRLLEEGVLLSVKGFGRVSVEETAGTSKKGKQRILVTRYL